MPFIPQDRIDDLDGKTRIETVFAWPGGLLILVNGKLEIVVDDKTHLGGTLTKEVTLKLGRAILHEHGVATAHEVDVPLQIPSRRDSWYFVAGVRYCSICRTRRCVRQPGGVLECVPEEQKDPT